MLAFVTSMPHPKSCASYVRRSELLSDTLRSVLGQTHSDFRIVIVANEPPDFELPNDERIEIALVSFPPPDLPIGRPLMAADFYADKGSKLAVGAAVAVRQQADYVMFVDSDDYVHHELAAFVSRAKGQPGWYSDTGYFHVHGVRSVTAVNRDFHKRNGSTHILRTDLLGVHGDIDVKFSREEVLDRVGRLRARSLMGDHQWIVSFFEDLGEPLAPLPFPAAIWEIGTKENFTRVLAAAGKKVPIAGRISNQYGLAVPTRASSLRNEFANASARVTSRIVRTVPWTTTAREFRNRD